MDITKEVHTVLSDHPIVQEKQHHGVSRVQNAHEITIDPHTGKRVMPRHSDLNLRYKPKRSGCMGCLIQCQDHYPLKARGGGAISCTLYRVQTQSTGINEPDFVLETALMAVKHGIDLVTAMRIIGWVIDLHRMGLITAKDTDSIAMEYGSKEAVVRMFKKMIYREGFGDVLADGILPVAKVIGRNSIQYANHVKGLPLYVLNSPEEIIPEKGQALAMVMSSRGDSMKANALKELDKTRNVLLSLFGEESAQKYTEAQYRKIQDLAGDRGLAPDLWEGKPEIVIYMEDIATIADCLGVCKQCGPYIGYPFEENYQAALFSAATGIETSEEQLFEFAKRIKNTERSFCVREGMTRKMDVLPPRFLDQPQEAGEHIGKVLETNEFEEAKSRYYALREWDISTGIPTRETLEKYGLSDIAQDLERRGKLPRKAV